MNTTPKQTHGQTHTPTPWFITDAGTGIEINSGSMENTASSKAVAKVLRGSLSKQQQDANAELIVRAVNSHASLVEALKDAVKIADKWMVQFTETAEGSDPEEAAEIKADRDAIANARAALARATT